MILKYAYQKIVLSFKNLTEYKTNFYSAIFSETIYLLSLIFTILVLKNFNVLEWSTQDYIIYFLSASLIEAFSGILFWSPSLKYHINEGRLNQLMTKPLNPFLQKLFTFINIPAIITFILDFCSFVLVIVYFRVSLKSLLLICVLSFLISIALILLVSIFDAINFFSFGLSLFIDRSYYRLVNAFNIYPISVLRNMKYSFVLVIMNSFFSAFYIVPLANNLSINYSIYLILLFAILVLYAIVNIMWHYGLKRYEGYN